MDKLTILAIEASIIAGKQIMEVFNSDDFGVRLKTDDSPLTEADLKSHLIIENKLKAANIPVLSEEGVHLDFETRKQWGELWIVDPLDGTKEFIKRSGEFTVNIALIKNQKPVMGVVFAPFLGWLYWGDESGAYKSELDNDWILKNVNDIIASLTPKSLPGDLPERMTAVASVSHFSEETKQYIDALKSECGDVELVSRGSSLKMCLVAEGAAHLYPRLGPTMEWDTAAGQAVVEAAGGNLYDWQTKKPMQYNRPELRNGWFLTVAKGLTIDDYWLK